MASCMMDYLSRTAQNFITKSQFCGIQWRVDQHGKAKWSGTLGQRDIRSGTVLENDTIYRIYSMTKPLVSVLALKLIEEGKIRCCQTNETMHQIAGTAFFYALNN